MARRGSKSVQRAFPWRHPFLAALRREPEVKLACKAAGISRNSAYAHRRKDARFRRQCEHAFDRGQGSAYRLHLKKLAADPHTQRALERLRSSYGSDNWPYVPLRNLVG